MGGCQDPTGLNFAPALGSVWSGGHGPALRSGGHSLALGSSLGAQPLLRSGLMA